MAHSEERPSKIRKLDSAFDDDQVSDLTPSVDVGSLNCSKEDAEPSTTNDPAEAIPLSVKEGIGVPLAINDDDAAHENTPANNVSKNQLKKRLKKQKWEEGREYRKAKQKEKKKEKKLRKAQERAIVDQESTEDTLRAAAPHKKSHFQPVQLPITFVLDCDFDDLMTEAEIISLGSQLTRSYSDNKHAPYQAHLVISSFGGKLKLRFETILTNNHLGWKGVKFTGEDFVAAAREADAVMRAPKRERLVGPFASAKYPSSSPQRSLPPSKDNSELCNVTSPLDTPSSEDATAAEETLSHDKHPAANDVASASVEQSYSPTSEEPGILSCAAAEKSTGNADDQGSRFSHEPSIVYLTSDSPHTLDVLLPYTTYVIGGLVDKNRHKGICYKRAMERNIPTAKLPIGEYMNMQSRSVLATNHVVEIMVRWLENRDWGKAFLQVIPKRKEARLKIKTDTGSDQQNKEDDNACSSLQGDEVFEEEGH
jgi:tRNA (guanine9-N1)-methyltransferase